MTHMTTPEQVLLAQLKAIEVAGHGQGQGPDGGANLAPLVGAALGALQLVAFNLGTKGSVRVISWPQFVRYLGQSPPPPTYLTKVEAALPPAPLHHYPACSRLADRQAQGLAGSLLLSGG